MTSNFQKPEDRYMTFVDTVPAAVRDIFITALAQETTHIAALPDPLPLATRIGLSAPNGSSRERIRVRAEHDDTGYFLDFFQRTNDGETSWHGRVHEDGSITQLENYERRRIFDDPEQTQQDRERVAAHNKQVKEILQAKSLYF